MPPSPSSIRLDPETECRVKERALKSGCSQSEWKRRAISAALDQADLAALQARELAGMAKQLTDIEKSVSEIHSTGDRALDAIHDLEKTLTVERAADRAVAQQIYRMALRSALLCIKIITDGIPEDERAGLGAQLSKEADDVFEDMGLARLDQVMRDAREEVRQTLDRGGVS